MANEQLKKLNIGCGRLRKDGYIGIDRVQFIDGNGNECVDIVLDVERNRLPFPDNSCAHILVENILEHIGFHTDNPDKQEALIFFLNECHRALNEDGLLEGNVPPFPSNGAIRDITHKRFFVKESFDYLTGSNPAKPESPGHPKYADYEVKPWYRIYVDDGIRFKLRPRKTKDYNQAREKL